MVAWTGLVADLRVRPFTDKPSSVVSGSLGRRASPLLDGLACPASF